MNDMYKKLLENFNVQSDEFIKLITPEQKTLFEKICELNDEISSEGNEQFFIEGVKFGIRLGIECIQEL